MSNTNQNKEQRLQYLKNQFEITKLLALRWHAIATTGVATLRDTHKGRSVTEQEKANGEVIGWMPHSDQEKINNALNTMLVHIRRLDEINDLIYDLLKE